MYGCAIYFAGTNLFIPRNREEPPLQSSTHKGGGTRKKKQAAKPSAEFPGAGSSTPAVVVEKQTVPTMSDKEAKENAGPVEDDADSVGPSDSDSGDTDHDDPLCGVEEDPEELIELGEDQYAVEAY